MKTSGYWPDQVAEGRKRPGAVGANIVNKTCSSNLAAISKGLPKKCQQKWTILHEKGTPVVVVHVLRRSLAACYQP